VLHAVHSSGVMSISLRPLVLRLLQLRQHLQQVIREDHSAAEPQPNDRGLSTFDLRLSTKTRSRAR
jgi:hypothetical protein